MNRPSRYRPAYWCEAPQGTVLVGTDTLEAACGLAVRLAKGLGEPVWICSANLSEPAMVTPADTNAVALLTRIVALGIVRDTAEKSLTNA